jgi:hypothetical protein
MATKAQIKANRLNAQKSTGPKTLEGKSTAAQNALKHGFCSAQLVLLDDDPAAFDAYSQNFLRELNPKGPVEKMLADRIIGLSWRLSRFVRTQDSLAAALAPDEPANVTQASGQSVLHRNIEYGARLECAGMLDNLLRHETRLEKSLYKSLLELQRLQFIRTKYQSLIMDHQDYDDADFQQKP